jgi:hypothetical protein
VVGVSAAPQADGVDDHLSPAGDGVVGVAVRGIKHDPGADDLLVSGGTGIGQLLEPAPLRRGQHDLAGTGDRHAEHTL